MDGTVKAGRALLVKKYLAHPQSWPDGIENKANPWYTTNKEYWDALAKRVEGSTVGTMRWLDPADDPFSSGPVTKNKPVTKKVTANNVTELVTVLAKRGRPKTGKAMSVAERVRRSRAKPKDVTEFKG